MGFATIAFECINVLYVGIGGRQGLRFQMADEVFAFGGKVPTPKLGAGISVLLLKIQ